MQYILQQTRVGPVLGKPLSADGLLRPQASIRQTGAVRPRATVQAGSSGATPRRKYRAKHDAKVEKVDPPKGQDASGWWAAPTAAVPTRPAAPSGGTNSSSGGGALAHMLSLQSFMATQEGPPRVMSILGPSSKPAPEAEERPSRRQHLPLLLYLPGIDGTGLAASRQFPCLLNKFDVRTFVIPPKDRTCFADLVRIVADFLRYEVPACSPTRPVYVLGESFGGLLAAAVAAEVPALVDRLVLVNPATSYTSSLWPLMGPLLPQMPTELYKAMPMVLGPLLSNPTNLLVAGLDDSQSLKEKVTQLVENATTVISHLPYLTQVLPAETLAWKLELLRQGSQMVEPQLPYIQQRTFVLVSDEDQLLPSGKEGLRLHRIMPRVQLRMERGHSHALLQEGGVDLAAILEEEGFYVRHRNMSAPISKRTSVGFGPIAAPVELPTPVEVQRVAASATGLLRSLTSPVFISTGPDGRRSLGLGHIPHGRPLLLVGNHQSLSLDMSMLVERFMWERGTLLRGLAHPVIFEEPAAASGEAGSTVAAWDPIDAFGNALAGRGLGARDVFGLNKGNKNGGDGRSAFRNFMTTYGAVPVSPFNMHRLLHNKEAVLLFPGGVREAQKGRGEEYQLFWPEKSEFIRMAARFGATIVPFAAVGVDDSLNILAEGGELAAMPVVGDMLRRPDGAVPQARRGVSAAFAEEETFIAPLVAPKMPPNRVYYVFQEPIHTSPVDLQDRERCDELYRATRQSVEAGIRYLLQRRDDDPFKEFLPRALYEAAYPGKSAPTFQL